MFDSLPTEQGDVIAYRLAAPPKGADAPLLEIGVDTSDLEVSRKYFDDLTVSLDRHLDFIFAKRGQRNYGRTRFTDGSIPVLYSALAPETAIAERGHWLSKGDLNIVFELIAIDFRGKYKNLLRLEVLPKYLTGERVDGAYEACMGVTQAATKENLDAFQTPSARYISGVCFPILTRASIRGLRPDSRVRYQQDEAGQWTATIA